MKRWLFPGTSYSKNLTIISDEYFIPPFWLVCIVRCNAFNVKNHNIFLLHVTKMVLLLQSR